MTEKRDMTKLIRTIGSDKKNKKETNPAQSRRQTIWPESQQDFIKADTKITWDQKHGRGTIFIYNSFIPDVWPVLECFSSSTKIDVLFTSLLL